MSKRPKGIYLEPGWIDSKAFMDLSGTAVKVLIWFMRRRQMEKLGRTGKESWSVANNGAIVFTYAEAEKKFGLTRTRFSRALNQLIELGFIDIAYHGGGLMGDCTLYAISDRWKHYGTDQFVFKTRPKDTRKLGFTKDNWEERTGKIRKSRSKQGNRNDTCPSNKIITLNGSGKEASSNKKDTERIDRKALILKAMRFYMGICDRSSKSVTVL
jgi:hypothetical protein